MFPLLEDHSSTLFFEGIMTYPSRLFFGGLMRVSAIPFFETNFCYAVECMRTKKFALVDVGDANTVLNALPKLNLQPSADSMVLLTTHKHRDHCGGNSLLAGKFKCLQIYGGRIDSIPMCTHPLDDGDVVTIGELRAAVISTSPHTRGHVMFHVFNPNSEEPGALFTGDTIFVGGAGAFFEGNAEAMIDASRKFALLPPDTTVYPGHDYTERLMDFACTMAPGDSAVEKHAAEMQKLRADTGHALPTSVKAQVRTNPFVRCVVDDKWRQERFGARSLIASMAEIDKERYVHKEIFEARQ